MKGTKNHNKYLNWLKNKVRIHEDDNDSGGNSVGNDKPLTSATAAKASKSMTLNKRIFSDSLIKLDPRYLAKNNPVMSQ